MAVNLQKGQKVDLTKGRRGLREVIVGLGWDPVEQERSLFGSLFGKKPQPIDCDASAIVCGPDGKINKSSDLVYFGNLTHSSGCIIHKGDNLTGEGEGDDEQIIVILDKMPENICKIVFVVNIFQASVRKQHFGMIKNAFIRVVDAATNEELCRYNLSDRIYDGMTAMIFGELYRDGNEWKFGAIGEATKDDSVNALSLRYR